MFYSFLAKGTLITLADETTKPVEKLVKDDEVLTYNYSAKNHDGAHLENNELRVGTIANLIHISIPRKDTVKVTLSNGNEIVVTKDFPLIGAGKATGWQVYDAISYVKSHKDIKVTSIKELEDIIKLTDRIKPKETILTNLHSDLDYDYLKNVLPKNVKPAFDGLTINL